MSTVPELPDELHELIAKFNRRNPEVFALQWIKQQDIFQIVVHPCTYSKTPANFEWIKSELEERIKTTQRLSKSLPLSINRMNEVANNWQMRLAMNDDTKLIGPIEFCAIAKDITESLSKTCQYSIVDVTEKFMMRINTQFVTFAITRGVKGEVPCKAYRQAQNSSSCY